MAAEGRPPAPPILGGAPRDAPEASAAAGVPMPGFRLRALARCSPPGLGGRGGALPVSRSLRGGTEQGPARDRAGEVVERGSRGRIASVAAFGRPVRFA